MFRLILVLSFVLMGCEEKGSSTLENAEPSYWDISPEELQACQNSHWASRLYSDGLTSLEFNADCSGHYQECGADFIYRYEPFLNRDGHHPFEVKFTSKGGGTNCPELNEEFLNCDILPKGGAGGVLTAEIEINCFGAFLELNGVSELD